MRYKILVIWLVILTLALGACKKEDMPKTFGEDSINSERVLDGNTYSIMGFSFSEGSVVLYNPQQTTNPPDLFVLPITDQGNVVGAYLDTPILNSFALVGTYNSEAEAQTAFSGYTTVDVSDFTAQAQPILENQVWVFKSKTGNYAKLLILDIRLYKVDITANAEVRFKWVYQPDGSTSFPG